MYDFLCNLKVNVIYSRVSDQYSHAIYGERLEMDQLSLLNNWVLTSLYGTEISPWLVNKN